MLISLCQRRILFPPSKPHTVSYQPAGLPNTWGPQLSLTIAAGEDIQLSAGVNPVELCHHTPPGLWGVSTLQKPQKGPALIQSYKLKPARRGWPVLTLDLLQRCQNDSALSWSLH